MKQPIIFLAFANDRDDYLPLINRERKNITRTMRTHEDNGLVRVIAEASSSLEDIFELFNNYPDEVAIFHYGGHAGGTHLQLESADDAAQRAHAGGLAQLLGQQKELQLVFLNGCATRDQVEVLFKAGVKAVIATSVSVQDEMATEFAEQFYNALSSHTSLERAFQIASAFVAAKYASFQPIQVFRDVVFEMERETAQMPWGLYVREDAADTLQWTLPKRSSKKQVLRNRYDYETRMDVNDILIDIICEQVARYNPDLDYELGKAELDIPSIKREIIDSFPTPIGEQLRKLFTRSNDPGDPDDMEHFTPARLEQLIHTYRTTLQFICFVILSQLWDEKHQNPGLEIREDYIVDFNSFFGLNPGNFQSFNYGKLIRTITEIFDDHRIEYFIPELKQVNLDIKHQPELYDAYIYLNELHERQLAGKVAEDELETLCAEAEAQLGIILREVAFLVQYKLVTIKNVEIVKERHQQPAYRHHQIMLNQALTVANTGVTEIGVEFNTFTDNKSILFLKTRGSEIDGFLNLTPFIIDENALSGHYSSKLFLYACQDRDKYYYQFLNNHKDDLLVVDQGQFPDVQEQMDRFKADIFGRPAPAAGEKKTGAGQSRFSRKR